MHGWVPLVGAYLQSVFLQCTGRCSTCFKATIQ